MNKRLNFRTTESLRAPKEDGTTAHRARPGPDGLGKSTGVDNALCSALVVLPLISREQASQHPHSAEPPASPGDAYATALAAG